GDVAERSPPLSGGRCEEGVERVGDAAPLGAPVDEGVDDRPPPAAQGRHVGLEETGPSHCSPPCPELTSVVVCGASSCPAAISASTSTPRPCSIATLRATSAMTGAMTYGISRDRSSWATTSWAAWRIPCSIAPSARLRRIWRDC